MSTLSSCSEYEIHFGFLEGHALLSLIWPTRGTKIDTLQIRTLGEPLPSRNLNATAKPFLNPVFALQIFIFMVLKTHVDSKQSTFKFNDADLNFSYFGHYFSFLGGG